MFTLDYSQYPFVKKRFYKLSLLIILSAFSAVHAQGFGKIAGVVMDISNGEPLPGANVFLEGTSIGASTNLEGQFVILNVPAGTYDLVVKYIGYKDLTISITVNAGETLTQVIEAEYVAIEGETIEITAQAEGQIQAINQQLASNTIKNIVSADRIQDVPDANAAESIGRLPGISIVRSGGEGQKVTIRGLSPKYNVMMVNGVRMQSNDRDDRSVDLNMIAPNVLSGIEVTKALTADMDADAVGGTVNLRIGKAREGFNNNFTLQGGYGQLAETYGNYKFTGFVSNRFYDSKFGVQLSGFTDRYNRGSDKIDPVYNSQASDALVFERADLTRVTISDVSTERQRAGGSLILDYQFSNGFLILNNFLSNLHQEQIEQQNDFYTSLEWRGFAADRESDNTVFSNALQGEFEFFDMKMDFSLANSVSKQHNPGDLRMDIRTLSGGAIGLNITPGLGDPKQLSAVKFINSVSVNSSNKIASGTSTLIRDVDETSQSAALNFTMPFTFADYLSGNFKFGGKLVRDSRKNDETQYGIATDRNIEAVTFIPLIRDSLWPELGITLEDDGIPANLFGDPDYDVGNFLSGEEGVDGDVFYNLLDISKMHKMERLAKQADYYKVSPLESSQYDYNYTRNFGAFYISSEINVSKYITLFPGIRYEKYSYDYTADSTVVYTRPLVLWEPYYNSKTLHSDVTQEENWFPQMQMRIKPLDWLDLRLASTKSIIYPDYRAVSPYLFKDRFPSTHVLRLGNPALKPALTQNYDIYASVYENYIGLFTVGYFYKEIDNLIVQIRYSTKDASKINNRVTLDQNQPTDIYTWTNLEKKSNVSGIELDWQTNFWYLPSYLKGLVLNINYTHTSSETFYPFYFTKRLGNPPFFTFVTVDSTRSGRLIDQPNDILNVTVGYDIGGFSARLSYLYQDDVFGSAGTTFSQLDNATEPYSRWDFTAFQELPWYDGLQLYLNLNNFTNEPDKQYTSRNLLAYAEYFGMTADFGIRYTF